MTATLALVDNGAALPGMLREDGYQIGDRGKIAMRGRNCLHPSDPDTTRLLGSHAMHDDATTPIVPDGYVLPPPINFGVLGVFQRAAVPTPETVTRVRAEVFGNKDLCPRERGDILAAARIPVWENERGLRIYFAQSPDGGRIKIGCSKRVRARLTELRADSGIDIRLLGTMPGGFEDEKEIHRQFAGYGLPTRRLRHGDWYFPAPVIKAFIAENTELRSEDEYARLNNRKSWRFERWQP